MRIFCGPAARRIALALAFALAAPDGGIADPPAQPKQPTQPQAGAQAEAPAAPEAVAGLGPVTNLPLPRYLSLRSDEVNVRRGPGLEYRVDWVFLRRGMPVRIIDEYGDWRRVVDADDAGGWVYQSLLTGRRTVLVTAPEVSFRAKPADTAAPTARAEQGVVAHLLRCLPEWCQVEVEGAQGWLRKSTVWGVEPDEVYGG